MLALDALQQARQVAASPFSGFGANEATSDPCVQLLPSVRTPFDCNKPEST